jgi:two-component system sensor histidine kinase AlgZ
MPMRPGDPSMPPPHGPAPADSLPASDWPASAPPAEFRSTGFSAARFDPVAEERAREDALTAAAFDVCHPALALRAVLLVQAVFAVAVLATATGRADWVARQGACAFAGAAGTLVWLVLLCSLRTPLRRLAVPGRVAVVSALGGLAAAVGWLPLWAIGVTNEAGALRVAGVLGTGIGLALLLWAWLDLRARIWQPATASARLAELQSRIRPHFLFNALNTALALVRVDPEKAEAVLEDLAELFRVALADVGVSVSLDEEIDLARRYLAIEQVRFGERMRVHWHIDPRIRSARVPALMLQPLVENAVRHGIEPSLDGGHVTIEGVARRGQVVLTVRNTVGEGPARPGHGMALHNVRERLRLLHDVAAQCDVWREGDQFHARVVLPL